MVKKDDGILFLYRIPNTNLELCSHFRSNNVTQIQLLGTLFKEEDRTAIKRNCESTQAMEYQWHNKVKITRKITVWN